MSLLDIAILAVLALGALRGLLRGLIKEAAALTALLLGGWLAFRYHEKAAVLLHGMLPPVAARMVAFILLLILVGLAAHLLGNLLTGLVRLALLGWVNRLGGMVLGCLEGALVLGMFFYAVVAVPFSFPFKETVQKHPFAHPLASFGGSTLDRAKTLRQQSP
ncbi:CvpA family protein [Trichlorobacter lovleyi]|uniref:Colicin V production protein n=1 Tax=Trichlorobacter lovleyi (strain ATCC BAA-1151 / DSM 17278 / SZ) TaxID=398767 RepID=B3E614_TRIL1|nr:CvpA family protein [Trichlorobacter lovleyi]ACD94738.1 Colicin V production protein [Trichlorobacter lovleyi SZ]